MPKAKGFIEFEMTGDREMAQKFHRSQEFMLGAFLTAFRRIGRMLVPALKSETPVGARGKLRSSTVFQVLGKGQDMRLEIRQSAFSPGGFAYGVAVREGTKPHFPPIAALIPWVVKKLGIGDPKRARTAAFLIARKISKVGTKANPYHERVFQSNVSMIRRIVNEEMVNVAAKLERK